MTFSIYDLWKIIEEEDLDIVEAREALLMYRKHRDAMRKARQIDADEKGKKGFKLEEKKRSH